MMPGVAVTDEHSTASVRSVYDPEPEPSAQWGWHGGFPRAGRAAGWLTAIALFAMLIGNHTSHVEDVYLVGFGSVLVVVLIASHLKDYRARRR
jgi:hypothetical protein